jgi:two-component system LytT family response regulator
MIKAILVDDEEKSRNTLKSLIEKNCPSIEICDLAESVDEALVSIKKHQPKLIFLDIEMPHGSGFTLLEKVVNPDFDVIFTTAYNDYAIKAIKFSALDYLLKPIDVDDLIKAVNKVKKNKESKQSMPDFELLLSNLKLKSGSAKIAVPTFDGLQMIDAKNIVMCIADESYTHLVLSDGSKIMVSRILKEYEELLSDLNFFRAHNSCLINLAHVTKYVKGEGGYVIMSNTEMVTVSRRKKTELLERLAIVHL